MFTNRFTNTRPILMVLLALLLASDATAQVSKPVKLRFVPQYSGSPVIFEKGRCIIKDSPDSIQFTRFRFYISHIVLMNSRKDTVWRDTLLFRLVDAGSNQNLEMQLHVPPDAVYSSIGFYLGVDSATNAAGAAGGDLDPLKGMYWAWHSGYINVKIEGQSPRCKTRKNEFGFHLGGFRENENCERKLVFDVKAGADILMGVDLANFMQAINLNEQHTIMTPGPASVRLSAEAARMFIIMP